MTTHQETHRQQTLSFADQPSLDEKWATWSQAHPDILILFERFAYELKNAGRKRAGAKLLAERLRWHALTSAHGVEAPAIDNNMVSRMARWLMEKNPEDFGGFFEVRRLRSRGEE